MIVKDLEPKTITKKENTQPTGEKKVGPIRMLINIIIGIPYVTLYLMWEFIKWIPKFIWNNKYKLIIIASIIGYLVMTYGVAKLERVIVVLLGSLTLFLIITNFWAFLCMIFYGGFAYFVYWAVCHELAK